MIDISRLYIYIYILVLGTIEAPWKIIKIEGIKRTITVAIWALCMLKFRVVLRVHVRLAIIISCFSNNQVWVKMSIKVQVCQCGHSADRVTSEKMESRLKNGRWGEKIVKIVMMPGVNWSLNYSGNELAKSGLSFNLKVNQEIYELFKLLYYFFTLLFAYRPKCPPTVTGKPHWLSAFMKLVVKLCYFR